MLEWFCIENNWDTLNTRKSYKSTTIITGSRDIFHILAVFATIFEYPTDESKRFNQYNGVMEWCNDNFIGRHTLYKNSRSMALAVELKDDAFLFKLAHNFK